MSFANIWLISLPLRCMRFTVYFLLFLLCLWVLTCSFLFRYRLIRNRRFIFLAVFSPCLLYINFLISILLLHLCSSFFYTRLASITSPIIFSPFVSFLLSSSISFRYIMPSSSVVASRKGPTDLPGLPVRFSPPFLLEQYIVQESARHYVRQFAAFVGAA